MSKLDKEKVLSEFSEAYTRAHGKAPIVEEKSGWYSVDGGKNIRLAKIAEWATELGQTATPKAASTAAKPIQATKSTPNKTNHKPAVTISKSGGGLTPKETWLAYLAQEHGQCRPPRGLQSDS